MNTKRDRGFFLRTFGSLRLTLILLAAFALASGTATFIETAHSSVAARDLVYNALWFEALLALLILNLSVLLWVRMPYRLSQTGFVMVHVSIILILLSAGLTRYFGYEGSMPIREGKSTDYLLSQLDHLQVQVGEARESAPVRLWRAGPGKLTKTIRVAGDRFRLRVLEYWPHSKQGFAEGEGGEPLLSFAARADGGVKQFDLRCGDEQRIGGVRLRFLAALPEAAEPDDARPFGFLRVGKDGETKELAVVPGSGERLDWEGLEFTILDFQPDFKVGQAGAAGGPMINPAIRVGIVAEDGASTERLLFALHPDFDMGSHVGEEDLLADLNLRYVCDREIAIAPDGNGGLEAQASFDLTVSGMSDEEEATQITAGDIFPFLMRSFYSAEPFALVPKEYFDSAVLKILPSDKANSPSAVMVEVTGPAGDKATTTLVRGRTDTEVNLGSTEIRLAFGSVRIPLPYSLHLDDFQLITYPGSDNPASFESHVRLFDEEQGIEGDSIRIYMNHPLTYRGYKHFQSSYDPDRRGTVLSVNHDPGKWPTYFAYALISVGFVLILAKGLLRPKRKRTEKEAA